MTKKKKSHNAGYQEKKKQKPTKQQQESSSSDDDQPASMKSMMNQIYANIPATVYKNGQAVEYADSRNAFSSFMGNLPSDSQQSMKELLSRNLNCDEDELEEMYGVPSSNQKNKKKGVPQQQQQQQSKPSTSSTNSNNNNTKKPTVNIFKMEPLGETLKEIRFATTNEFDEHSKTFVEFHNKCTKTCKDKFGMDSRTGAVPICTFDSELLELAREQAALTREGESQNKDTKREDDHVLGLEPFDDKTALPDWFVFKIRTKQRVIAGQLAATICKLFRLPLGSIRIIYLKCYNWKREYKEAGEFEALDGQLIGAFSNTKKGIQEFLEWKKKVELHSKSFGYFNTKPAEDIIKSNLDWREKSKRVFKLELDTNKPFSETENLNWLKYFHDRMITHKLHNDCCKDEVFDGSVEVIWNSLLYMIRNLYDTSLTKEYLYNFVAQNSYLSVHPNYRDHGFLCGFKSITRFYSIRSYGCVDFKYAFYHTTKYYSHVFYTNLSYRIINLADEKSREDESGWKNIWDNKLLKDPRFQEEDWIPIENRQISITLQEMKDIREALIGKDGKLNCIPLSKFIMTILDGATGAIKGESTNVNNEGWIDYRIRKICNEPNPEDANFKEHDFEKDIKEKLEEMKNKKKTKKNRNPMQSDSNYPNDEESANMYGMLKGGRGGRGGGYTKKSLILPMITIRTLF